MVKSIERSAFEGAFSWSCRKHDKHLKVPISEKILTDIPIIGAVASLVYLILYTTSDSRKAKTKLKAIPHVVVKPKEWGKSHATDELYNATVARFSIGMVPVVGRVALICLDILGTLMDAGHGRGVN